MASTHVAIPWIEVDSSLVGLLEVMADMQEGGSLECVTEVTDLGVASDEASKPIVGHAHGWDTLPLAAVLEAGLAKDGNLMRHKLWRGIWVRGGEDVGVVEEHDSNTFNISLVNSEGCPSTDINSDVVLVVNAGGILSEVACLALPVSLIVWGDDDDLLAEVCETDRQLIDHDSQATNCGPPSEFWSAENNWAERVGLED